MAGGTVLIFLMLAGTVWLTGSERIIRTATPWLLVLAHPYGWFGIDEGQALLGRLSAQADWLVRNSKSAGAAQFFPFLGACLRPTAVAAISTMVSVLLWIAFIRELPRLNRNLSNNPPRLVKILSQRFPGVVPVMHLGDKLILDKMREWRRQTWPEEVFLHTRIDGRPMSRGGKLDDAVARAYFLGVGEETARPGVSRRYSHMLGIHLVDVRQDAMRAASRGGVQSSSSSSRLAFPDRMSPEGKVMFALLCAHAFGDKADYWRATRELSFSCLGHPLGLPNLTVAQWCYDKYRTNETAHALFSIHHWEYTFLYALFFMAKRQGKVTHREWIWLKPLNRILFYCLNTVLRKAPPIEATTCWAQYGYERQVARLNRLPITADGSPVIMTLPGERALKAEFDHYMRSQDSDEDAWWKDASVWRRSAAAVAAYGGFQPVAPPSSDTLFDQQQRELERQAQLARDQKIAEGMIDIQD